MKTKEEVIKEAWKNAPKHANINSCGWLYFGYSCNGWDDIEDWLEGSGFPSKRELYDLDFYDHDNGDWGSIQIRPKSLQGIETNNGWIKIESEEDLPKEDGGYWFLKDGEIQIFNRVCSYTPNGKHLARAATHYQPIVKPLPPLY